MNEKDKMTFEVKWTGIQKAQLYSLADNEITVEPENEDDFLGKGRITVAYEIEKASVHTLDWELVFPEKLKNLEAWASKNGKAPKKIDGADEKEGKWRGHAMFYQPEEV